MHIHDLPARETLFLDGRPRPSISAPWACFDPDWYAGRYPDAPEQSAEALLEWHLREGQERGYSPNPFFDEAWQRETWTGILDLIGGEAAASAFDAWCRGAHVSRTPHWLFDPFEYRGRYPALTDEVLEEAGFANLYDHYLRSGASELRIAHALFDPAVYLAGLDPDEASAAAMPYLYYLRALDNAAPERRTSHLFDPDWYRHRYKEAAGLVDARRYRSLLEHYLCNDRPLDHDPSPWFSERYYLDSNPGLADAIGPGGFRNGFAHFLAHGQWEGRSPHPDLDLAWYGEQPGVREDIAAERAPGAFVHWITIGRRAGLPGCPPPRIEVSTGEAAELYRHRAKIITALFERHKLDFSHGGGKTISVVLPVGNQIEETMVSLASLHAQGIDGVELILIDAGNDDGGGTDIFDFVAGATVLRFGAPLDPAAARKAGLACVTTDAVLFLAPGVELAAGAVNALVTRLNRTPETGAVGGRLIQPNGRLQEAGGIIWRDAGVRPYMWNESPLAPEANFARATEVCSIQLLLVRRAVLTSLPAAPDHIGHDAADLCLRIRAAGYEVMYEPGAVAFLTTDPPMLHVDQVAAFALTHADYLATRPAFDPAMEAFARVPGSRPRRILFIEDSVPLRRIGSGFVRSNDILLAMASPGHAVTVFPMADNGCSLSAIRAELPDNVEVMHDRTIADLAVHLAERQGYYDLIWIARTHNLDRVLSAIKGQLARVIVDTEAVASARLAARAAVLGESFDLDAALREEFQALGRAALAIAVNDAEANLIRHQYSGPVTVLGHALRPEPTPRPFADRSGMLFVGAIHGMEHPNLDGLIWFADQVLPLIEKDLRWETRLTVAGYLAPGVSLERFRSHPRITLRGAVTDLTPLYDSHRVFVAPARFAAGLPFKVHEAAARGLPAVMTGLLARQLGWSDGDEAMAAEAPDAAAFARQVITLYRDEMAWTRSRETALARVAAELDPDAYAARVQSMVSGPDIFH